MVISPHKSPLLSLPKPLFPHFTFFHSFFDASKLYFCTIMPNFRIGGFPPVTNIVKNLIIINVLMFAITYTAGMRGINLDDYLALHYWQSPLFRWWQPFTHIFMHANVEHIFFNMFALYMFGSMLEQVWGPKRFIMFYIICGIGAAFFFLGVQTMQ